VPVSLAGVKAVVPVEGRSADEAEALAEEGA
jgi:hypothetical protein